MNGASTDGLLARFFDAGPKLTGVSEEVLAGLSRQPKRLSPKLLYDSLGCQLFDAICELPEYYPTRTELAILEAQGNAIAEAVGRGCVLVEPGAGSCRKVEKLLDSLRPAAYLPADIAGDHVRRAAARLGASRPWLPVTAICADFGQLDRLAGWTPPGRRVVFFPGSTIGNFEPRQAAGFLRDVVDFVGTGGGLLIGVDLKKERSLLNAAYNDAQGVTAAFNLNLLTRINRELDGEFDPATFYHRAFYNETEGRIEMHLVSKVFQQIRVGREQFAFAPGESIHTENSYKYSLREFCSLAEGAGLHPQHVWTDSGQLFSVHYFTVS